jgi:hypothetical protein
MRAELSEAIERAWRALGACGVWWTGEERLAIAREARTARHCALCRERKAAAIPHAVMGSHTTATALSPSAIDAVHRIVTDPGRLSEAWYKHIIAIDLTAEAYVELLSVVAMTTAIDTFDNALGASMRKLPPPSAGQPSRRRLEGAKPGLGWMPMLAPADVTEDDPPLYAIAGRGGGNVQRALSLVPQAMMQFWEMFEPMYLHQSAMRDFGREYRAVSHPQIEMMAARVAIRNQCVY